MLAQCKVQHELENCVYMRNLSPFMRTRNSSPPSSRKHGRKLSHTLANSVKQRNDYREAVADPAWSIGEGHFRFKGRGWQNSLQRAWLAEHFPGCFYFYGIIQKVRNGKICHVDPHPHVTASHVPVDTPSLLRNILARHPPLHKAHRSAPD